jgi:hypothetical protein
MSERTSTKIFDVSMGQYEKFGISLFPSQVFLLAQSTLSTKELLSKTWSYKVDENDNVALGDALKVSLLLYIV